MKKRISDFFGVRSIFISSYEHQKLKIPLLVFMSEIKINLTPEKIKFSVSFMLKCGKNNRQPSPQKTIFFS